MRMLLVHQAAGFRERGVVALERRGPGKRGRRSRRRCGAAGCPGCRRRRAGFRPWLPPWRYRPAAAQAVGRLPDLSDLEARRLPAYGRIGRRFVQTCPYSRRILGSFATRRYARRTREAHRPRRRPRRRRGRAGRLRAPAAGFGPYAFMPLLGAQLFAAQEPAEEPEPQVEPAGETEPEPAEPATEPARGVRGRAAAGSARSRTGTRA